MKMDKSVFGLRSGLNLSLQPTQEELRMFLASKKKEGGRELHGSVLAPYNEMLERVLSFRLRQLQEAPTRDEREKMFYGALSHSFFYNLALKSAVEQYKYQLHALSTIDCKKPRAFINTAREAIRLLASGKQADTADERKKLIETLNSRRTALVEELVNIALYIRDNLLKVANRCETSIAVLVDSRVGRIKENQLIADIKIHFNEQLLYDLHDGPVTRQGLENAKHDVALLSNLLSNNFRENLFALTQLYESIYDHTLKTAREIDALMAKNRKKKNRSFAEEVGLFTRVEKVLDSLVSGKRFELKATETKRETAGKDIFVEKRKEMVDHLFELMQKDRRSRMRRYRENRRISDDLQYQDPARRSESDRRAGKDRRKVLSLSA